MKNNNGLIIMFTLLFFVNVSYATASSLIGKWGTNENENATFEITSDSIYYLDEMTQSKYKILGDSLFITIDNNMVSRNQFSLKDNMLILKNKSITMTYVRMSSGRSPVVGILNFNKEFLSTTNKVENMVTYAKITLSFSSSSIMTVGTNYMVGTLPEDFRPDSEKNITYSKDGRIWNIRIKPTGIIYFMIESGKDLNANSYVNFGTLSYGLL
jgi:hypothetical protein